MILKLEDAGKGWIRVRSANQNTQKYIQYSIRGTRRRYNASAGAWEVHQSVIHSLILAARRFQTGIDTSDLPDSFPTESQEAPADDPYEKLHLRPNAPVEVVKAAYRALTQIHHPDRGGDTKRFQEISNAYQQIVEGLSA